MTFPSLRCSSFVSSHSLSLSWNLLKEERGEGKVEEGRVGKKRRKEEKRVGDESDFEGELSILLIRSEPKEKYSLRSVVTRMIEGALEVRAY